MVYSQKHMSTRQNPHKTLQRLSDYVVLNFSQRLAIKSPLKNLNLHTSQHDHQLFNKIPQPNPIAIHHSMLSCLRKNTPFETLKIFKFCVRKGGFDGNIDNATFAIALKACKGKPKLGCQIHGFSVSSGLVCDISVSNSLMSMYCKSSMFDQALSIFDRIDSPDIVSWNIILSGFENGDDALGFARQMNISGIIFDPVTYCTVLAHCADHEEFIFGTQLQSLVSKCGFGSELYVGNALITLYTKWGRIIEAEKIFYEIPNKDLVSWNAMVSGYAQEGRYGVEAIWAFTEMLRYGMKIDHVSLISAISACGFERNLTVGRKVHCLTIRMGYLYDVSVCNCLISMYSKFETINDALFVFEGMNVRSVVSWTTTLSMNEEHAILLFNKMRHDGVYPNDVTFVALIHAITNKNMVEQGQTIHGFSLKSNFLSKINVANSLVTMYARFESMSEAQKIFNDLEYRDTISWNALISGYAQNRQSQEAVYTYMLAVLEEKPNEFTLGSLLHAIGSAQDISINHGKKCHSLLIKLGFSYHQVVSGALLDMYSKRGSILESIWVFDDIKEKNHVSWTAIISAHARHGDYDSVMSTFREMERREIKPDYITFLSVLTACGRKGMVDMGEEIFDKMVNDHSIQPSSEHYSCMVDMLGRAGRLNEAEDFVKRIPGGPGLSVLQSLLGSCRTYGDVTMAKRVADELIEMEPDGSGSYVLLSNLYAERGEWEKVAKIRRGMRERGVKKEVGLSWVDIGVGVDGSLYLHGFSSDDKSHPLSEEIYGMARCIGSEMKFLERNRQYSGEESL